MKKWVLCLLSGLVFPVHANEVEILEVVMTQDGSRWAANVTLKHEDTGWEHYADGWRVVDEQGEELGMRVLYHPHVNEQPFTRSLSGIDIPQDKQVVYIEAHDKKHGWSKQRVRVELNKSSGLKYKVIRY